MRNAVSIAAIAGCLFLTALVWPGASRAQSIQVTDPWVRGTVQGQKATGAFMTLTSKVPARLIGGESPAAGVVEIHNMRMAGGVMKMLAVDGIDLPANRAVSLAPGGYHVMMMNLRQPLKAGDRVPLKLTFELADRKRETLELSVEVRALTGERKQHNH